MTTSSSALSANHNHNHHDNLSLPSSSATTSSNPTFTPSISVNSNPNSNVHLNLGLHRACATGNVGLVEWALSNGQPTNSVLSGFYPIHAAAAGGSLTCLNLLMSHGADVNAISSTASSAADEGDPSLATSSTSTSNPNTSNSSLLAQGSTALHFACANNHFDIVKCLLQNGANPNIRDREGFTPEFLALANNHFGIVGLLRRWNDGTEIADGTGEEAKNSRVQEENSGKSGFGNDNNQSISNSTLSPPLPKPNTPNLHQFSTRSRGDTESSSNSSSSNNPLMNLNNSTYSSTSSTSSNLKSQRSFEQLTSAATGVKNSLLSRRNIALGKVSSNPNLKMGSGNSSGNFNDLPAMPPFPGSAASLAGGSSFPRNAVFPSGRSASISNSNSPMFRDVEANNGKDESSFSTNQTSSPLQTNSSSNTSDNPVQAVKEREKVAKRRPSLPSILEKAAHPAQSLRNALAERGVAVNSINPSTSTSSNSTSNFDSFSMNGNGTVDLYHSPQTKFANLPSHSSNTSTHQLYSSSEMIEELNNNLDLLPMPFSYQSNVSEPAPASPNSLAVRLTGKRSIGNILRKATGGNAASSNNTASNPESSTSTSGMNMPDFSPQRPIKVLSPSASRTSQDSSSNGSMNFNSGNNRLNFNRSFSTGNGSQSLDIERFSNGSHKLKDNQSLSNKSVGSLGNSNNLYNSPSPNLPQANSIMHEQEELDLLNSKRKNSRSKSASRFDKDGGREEDDKRKVKTQKFNGLWARGEILPPSSVSVSNSFNSNSPLSPAFPPSPSGSASVPKSNASGRSGSGSVGSVAGSSKSQEKTTNDSNSRSLTEKNSVGNMSVGSSNGGSRAVADPTLPFRPRRPSTLSSSSNADESNIHSLNPQSHQPQLPTNSTSISPVVNRRRTQSSASITNFNRRFPHAENQPLPQSTNKTGFFPASKRNQEEPVMRPGARAAAGEGLEFLGEESKNQNAFGIKNRNRTNSDGIGRTNPTQSNLIPPIPVRMESFHSFTSSNTNSSHEAQEGSSNRNHNSSRSTLSGSSSPHLSPRCIPVQTFEETESLDDIQAEGPGAFNFIPGSKRRDRSNSRSGSIVSKPSTSSLRSESYNQIYASSNSPGRKFVGFGSNQQNQMHNLSAAEQAQVIFRKASEAAIARSNKADETDSSNADSNINSGGGGITDLLAAFGETLANERRNRSRVSSISGQSNGSQIDLVSRNLTPNGQHQHQLGGIKKQASANGQLSPRFTPNNMEESEGSELSGRPSFGSRSGKHQPPSPLLKELFLDANASSSAHPSEIVRSSSVTGIYNRPLSPSYPPRPSASGIVPPPNIRSNTLPVLNARNSEDLLRVGRYQETSGPKRGPVTPNMNQSPNFSNSNGLTSPERTQKDSSPRGFNHQHSPSMPQLSSGIASRTNLVGNIPRQLDFGTSSGGTDSTLNSTLTGVSSSNSNSENDKFYNSSSDSRVAGLGLKELSSSSASSFSNKESATISSSEREKKNPDFGSTQSTQSSKSRRNLVRNLWSGIKGDKSNDSK